MNDLFTYVLHQAAVSTLEPGNPVIHDLSNSFRDRTAIECANDLKDMFLNDDVTTWGDTEDAMDIPDIELGMCGLISLVGSMALEDEEIIAIAEYAVNDLNM